MSIIQGSAHTSAGGGTPANAIERSLRFNSADSAYLNRTPASAGNRKTWTWSGWVKRSAIANHVFFNCYNTTSTNQTSLAFETNGELSFFSNNASAVSANLITSSVYRDVSAWYHVVIAVDTTQATSTNRIKFYVNGTQVTAFSTATYPSQNYDTHINTTSAHSIGATPTPSGLFNGYMTEVNFIDGQALTPSSFGETDSATGVWKPKQYTGTYGTNGFYLPFKTASNWSGFFDGSGDYLTVADNIALDNFSGDFTIEFWVNFKSVSGSQTVLDKGWNTTSTFSPYLFLLSSGNLVFYGSASGSNWDISSGTTLISSVAANTWYHIAVSRSGNTIRFFRDGTQVATITSTSTFMNSSTALGIGGTYVGTAGYFLNGYVSNLRIVKGSAVYTGAFTPPTSQLTAITNTSLLTCQSSTFVDNSTNAFTITANGDARTQQFSPFTLDVTDDHSGTGNNWIPNNLDLRTTGSGADILVDTPTPYGTDTGAGGEVRGNYATLNPLDRALPGATFANGNLDVSTSAAANYAKPTIYPSTGKWYCEFTITAKANSTFNNFAIYINTSTDGIFAGYEQTGQFYNGSAWNGSAAYSTWAVNGVVGVALDLDAKTVRFYYNGTAQGSGTISLSVGSSDVVAAVVYSQVSGNSITANFGQRPFAYTAPSGFKALCTQNLPTPTIGATSTTQANKYFDCRSRAATGTNTTVTGYNFAPDLVWIKSRTYANPHYIADRVRGANKFLGSDTTSAENTSLTNELTAFTSDGYSLGTSPNGYTNLTPSARNYIDWVWSAGGSTGSTNTAGTITSTVSANTTSGFSIVTYTGNGSTGATVGHGLGVAPKMLIVKNRSIVDNWAVYHSALGATKGINLNLTSAAFTWSRYWNDTAPTSTVFTVGGSVVDPQVNGNGNSIVAYCFAEVAGYSAFGSYTGNGSADGPFVYTGFRPRYVLIKRTSNTQNWQIHDSSRNTYNSTDTYLMANSSNGEATDVVPAIDFLSNGFKIRTSNVTWNANTDNYIYAAFAESPFKYSLAR